MLPKIVSEAIASKFSSSVIKVMEIKGGCINHACQVMLADGQKLFVKWHHNPPPDMFPTEAQGLTLLASANKSTALRIPKVYLYTQTYLVVEWLNVKSSNSHEAVTMLGEGLANQHRTTKKLYGLEHNNYCGLTPQINTPTNNWPTFFATQRLEYQKLLAAKQNRLPTNRGQKLDRLMKKLPNLLPNNPPSSLLHGDLWGGNWLITSNEEAALIDPAVYFGHREADLAFTELFGGFPPQFYQAYQATWPLEAGYKERKDIYNLYHLLNHLNLFGEGYGNSVDVILNRYS